MAGDEGGGPMGGAVGWGRWVCEPELANNQGFRQGREGQSVGGVVDADDVFAKEAGADEAVGAGECDRGHDGDGAAEVGD